MISAVSKAYSGFKYKLEMIYDPRIKTTIN